MHKISKCRQPSKTVKTTQKSKPNFIVYSNPMESHNTNIRESLRTAQPPPQRCALKTKKFVRQEKNKKCVTFLGGVGVGGLHKNGTKSICNTSLNPY